MAQVDLANNVKDKLVLGVVIISVLAHASIVIASNGLMHGEKQNKNKLKHQMSDDLGRFHMCLGCKEHYSYFARFQTCDLCKRQTCPICRCYDSKVCEVCYLIQWADALEKNKIK